MSHTNLIPHDPTPIVLESDLGDLAAMGVSADDAARMVARVNQRIQEITGRIFGITTHINEQHFGNGAHSLQVKNPPINQLIQIRLNDVVVWDKSDPNQTFGVTNKSIGIVGARCGWGGRPKYDRPQFGGGEILPPWSFDYIGGFERIPGDLRDAGIEWVKTLVLKREKVGLKSETIGQYSYTSSGDSSMINSGFMNVIRSYRLKTGSRQ